MIRVFRTPFATAIATGSLLWLPNLAIAQTSSSVIVEVASGETPISTDTLSETTQVGLDNPPATAIASDAERLAAQAAQAAEEAAALKAEAESIAAAAIQAVEHATQTATAAAEAATLAAQEAEALAVAEAEAQAQAAALANAGPQEIELRSSDGLVSVVGTIEGFDESLITIKTSFGTIGIENDGIECIGASCPVELTAN